MNANAQNLTAAKMGRPRLQSRPSFQEDFCRLLPRVQAGEISVAEASKEMRISSRSFKRYMEMDLASEIGF